MASPFTPSTSFLADRLTPYLNEGFLFQARVCRAFYRAYTEQSRTKITSLQTVLLDTHAGLPSKRIDEVIALIRAETGSSGKLRLQTLILRGKNGGRSGRRGKEVEIPGAALVVLLLSRALRTRHALSFTKTIAKFFDVSPACLLLSHLTESGKDCIPTLTDSLKDFCLPEDLRELTQIFDAAGLKLGDLAPPSTVLMIELASFIQKGDVAAFHSCLTEHLGSFNAKEVAEVHNLLCRESRKEQQTDAESQAKEACRNAFEESLVSVCMKSGRVKECAIWYLLARRLKEGGSAKRLLELYVSRLADYVEEQLESRNRVDWFMHVLCCFCGDPSYCPSEDKMGSEGFHEILKGLLGVFAFLWKRGEEEEEEDADEDSDEISCGPIAFKETPQAVLFLFLRKGALALLRDFVNAVGVNAFFRMHEVMWWRPRACGYWSMQQIPVFRYLRQLRPDWRPALVFSQWDHEAGSIGRLVLQSWEEVEFLVFECELPWHGVLEEAFLDVSLHPQAFFAGAPLELLGDPDVNGPMPRLSFSLEPQHKDRWTCVEADEVVSDILLRGNRREMLRGAGGGGGGEEVEAGEEGGEGWEGEGVGEEVEAGEEGVEEGEIRVGVQEAEKWEDATFSHVGLFFVNQEEQSRTYSKTVSRVFDDHSSTADFQSTLFHLAGSGWKCHEGEREGRGYTKDEKGLCLRARSEWDSLCPSLVGQPSYGASMVALALGNTRLRGMAWRRPLGFLVTVGLLHRCGCLTVGPESVESLRKVSEVGLSEVIKAMNEESEKAVTDPSQSVSQSCEIRKGWLEVKEVPPPVSRLLLEGVVGGLLDRNQM
uniref:Uncharacterized protein n=1 Tax=Chromera velia CCMP2878 TaxID=1169474 RepID=A0A0G4FT08_9ALVE|eukprot:Cvel_18588.t1-p1 / transcript=Cvel_18588.t1 / gene=Cvel_18588 / organism=Chromera_velia_CCMP2878 / gene_product=hypothetical protein / transcript_product=hypothetical protein / location=Cvel_scaffold1550:37030-39498(-) / protein_length=823 / sequence_SO=supercontig / SO=protein_coding / is_pseudo=false